MTAYYNENEPFAAQWLRNLIAAGHIAPGDVDERSIVDVRPDDLRGYIQCHFFAGIGGWSYALRLAGWNDARPVWTGSCPCQPFSAAGKRKGFEDSRHLWPVFRDLIAECAPAVVFGEQVAAASDWLRLVRGDLEAMGRAVGAIPVEAASAGADHLRDRFWFVGYLARERRGEIGRPVDRAAGSGASRRHAAGTGKARLGVGLADTCSTRGTVGLPASPRRREGHAEVIDDGRGRDALAHAHVTGEGEGREQRSGQLGGAGGDQEACARPLSDGESQQMGSAGQPWERGHVAIADSEGEQRLAQHGEVAWLNSEFDWVIGADGKARRVKSGLCLLAHGIPGRVGLLRGFGNAIDPRPAAAFIKAADEAINALA